MGLEALLLSACLFFAGAIIEKDSGGQVTQIIMYNDNNITKCKNK